MKKSIAAQYDSKTTEKNPLIAVLLSEVTLSFQKHMSRTNMH